MTLMDAPGRRPTSSDAVHRRGVVVQRVTDREPWSGVLIFWPKRHGRAKVRRDGRHVISVEQRFVHLFSPELGAAMASTPGLRLAPAGLGHSIDRRADV